jgi:(+)-trans-carveol dehydrogenase
VGRFDGKVVFITGIARGQGRSHALKFAEEGADIVGLDACAPMPAAGYAMPTLDDLDETISMVEALGRRIVARQCDIRDADGIEAVVTAGVEDLGRLDVCVSSAAIFSKLGPTIDIPASEWGEMIDISLTGQWNTCKAAIPAILAGERGGSVIITSSGAGLRGFANFGHYVAAKHGLIGLMRTLANEYGAQRIRVNTVHPTNVNTAMIQRDDLYRLFRPDLENPTAADFEEASHMMHLLPVPWVETEDVTNAIVFLASDDARNITGVTLPVDAGAAIKTA